MAELFPDIQVWLVRGIIVFMILVGAGHSHRRDLQGEGAGPPAGRNASLKKGKIK
jgi:hypothetical protein